jgi:two-component system sensor kinase FixL
VRAGRCVLWDNFNVDKTIMSAMPGHGVTVVPDMQRASMMAVAFFALYVALDWLTYVFPARFGVTPFNPEAAVAIAMLMFCGVRYVPLVFLAALWGEYALPASARPLALMLTNSIILTLGYAVTAHLLTNRYRIRIELDTRRDVVRLMGVTLACMLIFGAAYVGMLVLFGIGPVDRIHTGTRRFVIGYSVGILVMAPLLFMLFSQRRRKQFKDLLRSYEAWAQIATILACVWWVFLQDQQDHIRNFYLLFLPLIWAATRFGVVGAASALVMIQAGVLSVLVLSGYQPVSVFELQLLLIALAITGLLLGVSIDEQRRASDDFRESLKLAAAGEMAAAITHELNQPLTALSGYATAGQLIAAMPHPDRAQLNDTMHKLMEESKRAAAVVRRLRDFFRSGATRLEPISINELAAQVVASLASSIQAARVTMVCHASADAPTVLVDPVQIEVVLRNLLMNAIESAAATEVEGGSVAVEIATNAEGEAMVAVRDNGAGVRVSDVQRLFESFATTKTSGMGMGLAISRAIVDAHGGSLWAEPGTTGLFCFTLPLESPSGSRQKN